MIKWFNLNLTHFTSKLRDQIAAFAFLPPVHVQFQMHQMHWILMVRPSPGVITHNTASSRANAATKTIGTK